jgi:hypothetical protein
VSASSVHGGSAAPKRVYTSDVKYIQKEWTVISYYTKISSPPFPLSPLMHSPRRQVADPLAVVRASCSYRHHSNRHRSHSQPLRLPRRYQHQCPPRAQLSSSSVSEVAVGVRQWTPQLGPWSGPTESLMPIPLTDSSHWGCLRRASLVGPCLQLLPL